ncbi:hypothetical protein AN958_09026 [Leucoagaricus sp. SymC.cos]|nr:hypothetical protein AN958_09026 [Leucoagaricus sp. SymC.cos]
MICYLWHATPPLLSTLMASSPYLAPSTLPLPLCLRRSPRRQPRVFQGFVAFAQEISETTQVSQSVIMLSLRGRGWLGLRGVSTGLLVVGQLGSGSRKAAGDGTHQGHTTGGRARYYRAAPTSEGVCCAPDSTAWANGAEETNSSCVVDFAY